MPCQHCQSTTTTERCTQTQLGDRTFCCHTCKRTCNDGTRTVPATCVSRSCIHPPNRPDEGVLATSTSRAEELPAALRTSIADGMYVNLAVGIVALDDGRSQHRDAAKLCDVLKQPGR